MVLCQKNTFTIERVLWSCGWFRFQCWQACQSRVCRRLSDSALLDPTNMTTCCMSHCLNIWFLWIRARIIVLRAHNRPPRFYSSQKCVIYPRGKLNVLTHISQLSLKSFCWWGCYGQQGAPVAVSLAISLKKPLIEDCYFMVVMTC